jgi:hypothetical protein
MRAHTEHTISERLGSTRRRGRAGAVALALALVASCVSSSEQPLPSDSEPERVGSAASAMVGGFLDDADQYPAVVGVYVDGH